MKIKLANYCLWGAVVVYIAFPQLQGIAGISLAGIIGIIGFILLLLNK
jgi:hypothetical protein